MHLTDTHCHLEHGRFDADRGAVIQHATESGLSRILVPGIDLKSSRKAVQLAESHMILFAAVGYHPTDLEQLTEDDFNQIKNLAAHPRVVAIGEIGIDYYWVKKRDQRMVQQEVLKKQLALAEAVKKPVVIHMREENDAWQGEASQDLIYILRGWRGGLKSPLAEAPGVLHSFNGTLETAMRALEMNFYIGISGPVTYKNAEEKRRIIEQIPLDRVLIETDAPYLTPVPHRGSRNEPAYVRYIADKIGEIHSISPAEVASSTTANAARLFAWGD